MDSVYGIVEVKSTLPKSELIDSLEKIKVLKSMAVDDSISEALTADFNVVRPKPKPFGVVFAYGLSGNSLDSLCDNLVEWAANNSPEVWPNYVCVLGVGCIHYQNGFRGAFDSGTINARSVPVATKYEDDSLFKFYCALHDLCSRMRLGPVELNRYFDPGVRIGRFSVFGRGSEFEIVREDGLHKRVRYKQSTIERIVSWCSSTEKMRYGDFLKKQFGKLPLGAEQLPAFETLVYLYNPDNLPGLGDLKGGAAQFRGNPKGHFATLLNVVDIIVDGVPYILAINGFSEQDWEEVE
ncbi:hypothetical protein [Herbaspirillum rubrisubalbicans]|uniref:hypothetical protein n=1 Tax=Herbaspirillum rubrisubalbicans TaxID=80842 RepID=UPI003F6869EB